MSIYAKLLKVQEQLKSPKGQFNKFGNYKYRSCEDILEALKPVLAENNLLIQLSDDLVLIGERYYIKAIACLIDVETGDNINISAYAREEETKKGMDGSQVTGASSSYARKYALNGMFAIDDAKDSDATNTGKGSDDGIKEKLEKYIMFLCDDDKGRYTKALEHYTKFTGKDGKEVAGVNDASKLSQARLKATYGKVKADYLKKGGKEDA